MTEMWILFGNSLDLAQKQQSTTAWKTVWEAKERKEI